MKHIRKNILLALSPAHRTRIASFVVVCALVAFAFVLSACSGNLIPSANAASDSVQTSASSAATSYPIKVFFSKAPDSGADARVQAEITATLKQFSNIKEVVILTKDGHCFGDESGKDFCLR